MHDPRNFPVFLSALCVHTHIYYVFLFLIFIYVCGVHVICRYVHAEVWGWWQNSFLIVLLPCLLREGLSFSKLFFYLSCIHFYNKFYFIPILFSHPHSSLRRALLLNQDPSCLHVCFIYGPLGSIKFSYLSTYRRYSLDQGELISGYTTGENDPFNQTHSSAFQSWDYREAAFPTWCLCSSDCAWCPIWRAACFQGCFIGL